MNILVGDIGGTHCRLATATISGADISPSIHLSHIQRYQNADHTNLAQILDLYFQQTASCEAACSTVACFAVAGPTDGHSVRFTNLDWHINTTDLIKTSALCKATLVNDFVAVGWGLNALQPQDLHILQTGQADLTANRIAVGAGTGLGVSVCVPHTGQQTFSHQPFPTEGGHIGFAPTSAEQDRLLSFLRQIHGRVSVERILSGPGLIDLYRFCLQEENHPQSELLYAPVPAKAISEAGLAKTDAAAVRALQLFIEIYGQVAGDIALVTLAQGGVYLAGGIAPQLLPLFSGPEFLAGFHAKGRYSDWMRSLPVAIVLDADIGLRGAAVAALAAV